MVVSRKRSLPRPFVQPEIFSGLVCMWSGNIGNLPSGWVLCDGNNGTPDLRDKFVVAAGTTYLRGLQSGGLSHYHEFLSNGHQHDMDSVSPLEINAGVEFNDIFNSVSDAGDTDTSSNLPVWYSIAYIMKT